MTDVANALVPIFGIFIPLSSIIGGVAIVIVYMYFRARSRQNVHRERLAMIERGLVPPSESIHDVPTVGRWIRSGIIMMSLGVGTGVLIGFASNGAAVRQAVGVGALFFCLGGGLFLVGYVESRRAAAVGRTKEPDASAPRNSNA